MSFEFQYRDGLIPTLQGLALFNPDVGCGTVRHLDKLLWTDCGLFDALDNIERGRQLSVFVGVAGAVGGDVSGKNLGRNCVLGWLDLPQQSPLAVRDINPRKTYAEHPRDIRNHQESFSMALKRMGLSCGGRYSQLCPGLTGRPPAGSERDTGGGNKRQRLRKT